MNKSINNPTYDRLKNLYIALGIDIKAGNTNDAEIYAYSRGIELVRQNIELAMGKLFCDKLENLDMYTDLLNIDPTGKTYDEIVSEIRQRLSMDFGDFNRQLFEIAFQNIGGNYEIVGQTLYFDNISRSDLPKLHTFLDSYKAFFNTYHYNNSGQRMTFDEWDKLQNSCIYYDNLMLCWNFLEEYKENVK